MMCDDIIVRYEKLPLTVKGFISRSNDDCYNIFLNKNLNHEQQVSALLHELEHVKRNDFDFGKSLELAESKVEYEIEKEK